ncbi:SusC/RagA family TonB-linked outer membrane protein [Alistipes sp.]|uniref:SusC/RagA family TonB-linked outer membrane protein n=1 Tax=Alistipes sp. TaxID=1872444 RepID=UPI0025C4D3A6|nr:SusC/RagA family TonB-linked outer membrane protein [Alistipes sp.]MCI7140112.1 SusC/RagA family TonB-linked outer membrane protein [Alistipes sp.]MDY5397090.1 SusC/RagA family TonB-linked outer membrane protein [Alistipes sp.]
MESAAALQANAQEAGKGTLEGVVKDASGPLLGATVVVKNTTRGTTTDIDGKFRLEDLENGDVLQVSYVGYDNYEVVYAGQTFLEIEMKETANQLNAVVVTAMGIERQSKTLTYAAETVGGSEVADIKSINMINSLQGKSAGLQITPNSTGAGGSSKILFRGNKSINGSNQPLVVVDGVPLMMNTTTDQVQSNYGGERDGGDAMSTINPDDIASISLLKGASAAALYGAVAANGAIMITTKSASAGRISVSVSSNTTVETPISLPEFQNTYGSSDKTYSWGPKLSSKAPNYAKEFYQTGWTTNNSVSISGGAENLRAYFSYGNISSSGITPENDYAQHTLNSKVGFDLFNDHVKVDFSAKYVNQHVSNQPAAGFLYNPLTGAYLFPRGEDWDYYKNNFEVYDATLNANIHNWVNTSLEQFDNPYWILNRQKPISERNRYEFGGQVKYQIIDGLSLTGRMRYERADDNFKHNFYASSTANRYPMGRMKDNRYFSEQLYADVMAQYDHTWGDFSLNATAGASMTRTQSNNLDLWAEGTKFSMTDGKPNGNIMYPNLFIPANYYANMVETGLTRKRLNSVFATATFGYKEGLFVDVTARNDWSSALAFTNGYSFFYPSVGASLLLDRFVDMGSNIDLFKFRASYSIVGNDVPAYMTNPLYTLDAQGAITPPKSTPFRTLEPEKTHSFEVGFDGEFLQHRLHVNATYYKTNTKNQFFSIELPWESGYESQYVNAGNVQNQGFELSLGWFQDFGNDFTWSTDLNLSYNDNKIIELVEGLQDGLSISNFGGAQVILKEGGHFGDLYVRTLKHNEDGSLMVNTVTDEASGTSYQVPVLGGENIQDLKYIGDMNSKVYMGWNNTFRYKDFSLSFLIDFRFGGKVLSMTEAALDGWGVSKRTAEARDRGYVIREGVKFTDVQKYYDLVGVTNYNSQYNNEDYVYDATNVRMREISLGYTFRDLFGQSKNLTVSLIARNLFFFYKDAPMDPDVSMGTGNGVQGFDIFNLPTTRSFGLNVKLNF